MIFLLTAMAIAAIVCTVTRSSVTIPLRNYLHGKQFFFAPLLTCPYCLANWLCIFVVPLLEISLMPGFWLNWLISSFAMLTITTIFIGLMFKLVLNQEGEINRLRSMLDMVEEE